MVLKALRGAVGFCSRLPVGRDEAAWTAFQRTPAAFPLAGYVVGVALALPVLFDLPGPTLALAFLGWVVVVTGVNHADGLADLGDAAVVHGSPDERRAVMHDTTVGVGAVLALGVGMAGLALAGLALADVPVWQAAALVLAAEVAAKVAVVALICLGDSSHDGRGAAFADHLGPTHLVGPALVTAPVLALGGWARLGFGVTFPPVFDAIGAWPPLGAAALVGAGAVAVLVWWWSRRALGGVGGDVFGATNELARVAALHAGVLAWTLW